MPTEKERSQTGGPTQEREDPSTADRDNRKVQSRDELKERSVKGDRPGIGERNGSDKLR